MSLPTNHSSPIDPKELEELEQPLIALASRCGGNHRKFLYAFFSFLHRRTDFYLVPHEEDLQEGIAKMGFREGDAEKLLLAAFRQFPLRRLPRQGGDQDEQTTPSNDNTQTTDNSKVDSRENETLQMSKSSETENPMKAIRRTEDGLQVPVGNGGSTDRYKWTQTLEECSVLIGIPDNVRAKDLSVDIKSTVISVSTKSPLEGETEPRVFLTGKLTESIVPSESSWTLEGGVLVLVLYKQRKTFWETVIEGDEKIDTSLVDSRRHIDEYDEATQAQIRKIIFEQSQARQGKPTSQQSSASGIPDIQTLPQGVEYIDQKILEERLQEREKLN